MLPVRTILYPTDFSERSDAGFRLACALARDYDARLIVLHVVPTPAIVYLGGVVPPEPDQTRQQLWDKLRLMRPDDPAITLEHRLVEGEPAPAILHLAEKLNCDLIVLGTHGRTGLGRFLMGSVAEQVLRRASCPVVTVKTPAGKTVPVAEHTAVEVPA
jgi:nucleotide-binding universal stress UspA family protein